LVAVDELSTKIHHRRAYFIFTGNNHTKWQEGVSKMLAYCETNEILPEEWIAAQFYGTVKLLEIGKLKLCPGHFHGPNAVKRYS